MGVLGHINESVSLGDIHEYKACPKCGKPSPSFKVPGLEGLYCTTCGYILEDTRVSRRFDVIKDMGIHEFSEFLVNSGFSPYISPLYLKQGNLCKYYPGYVNDTSKWLDERFDTESTGKDASDASMLVRHLNCLRKVSPGLSVIVETPDGSMTFKLGDANIYEGVSGEIVFDSE